MDSIKVIRIFNLVDVNGDKLQLRLGFIDKAVNRTGKNDTGLRWSFVGRKIPMPIRAYTWFNGFPEETMLSWLKANGWAPHTCISMDNFKVKVYDLPTSDGNVLRKEESAQEMYNSTISTSLEKAMKKISEAKDEGQTCCYIASSLGKPPVEVIQTLLNAGYDITYHSYNKGYGDWFVQVFWSRPCEQGKIFKGGAFENPVEVSIQDYKNA